MNDLTFVVTRDNSELGGSQPTLVIAETEAKGILGLKVAIKQAVIEWLASDCKEGVAAKHYIKNYCNDEFSLTLIADFLNESSQLPNVLKKYGVASLQVVRLVQTSDWSLYDPLNQ